MNSNSFEKLTNTVLAKYKDTSLQARWEDAVSFGEGGKVLAFWIRDSEDVVNIVWLCPDSIRDITWFPQTSQSTFSFLPLSGIVSVEVREVTDAARHYGFDVNGELLVRVFTKAKDGTLSWVAETPEQKRNLRAFSSIISNSCSGISR